MDLFLLSHLELMWPHTRPKYKKYCIDCQLQTILPYISKFYTYICAHCQISPSFVNPVTTRMTPEAINLQSWQDVFGWVYPYHPHKPIASATSRLSNIIHRISYGNSLIPHHPSSSSRLLTPTRGKGEVPLMMLCSIVFLDHDHWEEHGPYIHIWI